MKVLALDDKILALTLKNFHVLGLGLEKKVLALAYKSLITRQRKSPVYEISSKLAQNYTYR